jgi:putative heme degradation protein
MPIIHQHARSQDHSLQFFAQYDEAFKKHMVDDKSRLLARHSLQQKRPFCIMAQP